MIDKIKAFFQSELSPGSNTALDQHQRHLACAALLIEVAIVDDEFDQSELRALYKILQNQFGLSQEDCTTLTQLAQSECEEATSMYQFTQLINQHCDHQEKFNLIQAMWQVAYADGNLDKYEEYIIRKVADLIHVAHGDFMRAKHAARNR